MEFDKSKVYTSLNADELKVGSKIIVSNNLNDLMYLVNNISEGLTLRDIKPKCNRNRFEVINEHKEISWWNLAYLISEPNLEEKKLKWSDLKSGEMKVIEITVDEWNELNFQNGTYFCNGCMFDDETDNLIAFSWYEDESHEVGKYFKISSQPKE